MIRIWRVTTLSYASAAVAFAAALSAAAEVSVVMVCAWHRLRKYTKNDGFN